MSAPLSHNSRSGSALLIVLIVVVLAGAVGAYFYLKEQAKTVTPVESTLPPVTGDLSTAPVIEETDPMAPAVSVDGAVSPSTDDLTSGGAAPVLDIEQIMAPRGVGDVNAPIKIIEYASLTCSHCAHFHNDVYPALKAKYIDTGKVYFEFREFPLNDPALKATIAARCLPAAQYENFVSLLFKNQDQWAAGIDYMAQLKQNAKLAGLGDAQFEACQNSADIKLKLAENMQEAQDKWKVAATPTFIINEGAKTIGGAQPLEAFERAFREVTNGAVGEVPAVE